MKNLGIVLIILGIVMLIFRGFNFTQEKKVADIGPIEINKQENKSVAWPMYAGAVAVVAGVVLVLTGRKAGAA